MVYINLFKVSCFRAVGLQVALDLVHKRQHKDLLTKLRVRTNPGRPDWDQCLKRISREGHGEVTVFYCGNPQLARVLRRKCGEYGFGFRKEVF